MTANLNGNITAPYNFAPLSEHVFLPSWNKDVSIDVPIEGGVSGILDFTITAHTPLLAGVKSREKGPVEPFKFPDGRYGIPGSSLRGMVRNVLEIASFGKMSLVDDKRYGVRDLTPGARQFYGNKMTETAGRMKFKPKSKAGWLKFTEGRWQLLPCDFARVEHYEIKKYLGGRLFAKSNKDRPDAMEKYRFWKNAGKSLSVIFDADNEARFEPHSKGKALYYQKVNSLGSGSKSGEIVFTGQPGPSKHLEFVFHNTAATPLEIPERVMQGFMQIYRETDHWKALQSIDFENGIPVFYLGKSGVIDSLGLSLMYKLAYTNSIGEVVERVQGKFDAEQPDLAELIFGYLDEDAGRNSLKGRVSFAHATCKQDSESLEIKEYKTILNGPKPTYYPNYIVQQQKDGKLLSNGYATLMDPDAKIRGWKRYPVRPSIEMPILTREQTQNQEIQVKLKPLIPSPVLSFQSRMRFHNLTKCELGAIVWALEWGGNAQLRHALGMGKSFGFGQVSIALDSGAEKGLIPNNINESCDVADCVEVFVNEMELFASKNKMLSGWKESEQLTQLFGMANPENAPGVPRSLRHLDLNGGGRNNEFVLAKKDNKVLEPYVLSNVGQGSAGVSNSEVMPWDDSEAGKWLCGAVTGLSDSTNTPKKNVLHAKGLAEKWAEISDDDLKKAALVLIRSYWETEGWWDEPHGKSAIKAHRIYSSV